MQYIRSCLTAILLLFSLANWADSPVQLVPITATSQNGLYRLTVYPKLSEGYVSNLSAEGVIVGCTDFFGH